MGNVAGCAKKLCLENNIKEINVNVKDIENNNLTYENKNELTKPALNEHENGNININDDNSEEEEEEEEESESQENEEEEKNEQENNKDKKRISNYIDEIKKIILIQKTFRKHTLNNKDHIHHLKKSSTKDIVIKKNQIASSKYLRLNTMNYSSSHLNSNIKKNIHRFKYSKKNNEIGKSTNEEEQEIISVEQAYVPMQIKKSSKIVNNFKSIEGFRSSIILQNGNEEKKSKQKFLNIKNPNQNYLRILSDFGDRRQSVSINSNEIITKNTKISSILTFKEKKDIKYNKKSQDDIKGNFILKNDKVVRYQGGFIKKTKKKNGFGIVTWSDNSTLHGKYESSVINGICRFYNNKYKSTFIGEYVNNKPKGYGVYQIKSLSLQGYWEENYLNGIAIEVWEDGTYYQGEYENNKKDGIGLYRWPDGTIYQGEFCDGQMSGKGIILYSDDCMFSGEMLNGYMNGYGIFSWGNGSLYMGYYLQDTKHGFGIYIWDSKTFICYIGFWEMGKQQGIGVKINGNKIKYAIWNKGKITTTLKGFYEIDRYLVGSKRGYYYFFTAGYIAKLRANSYPK
jgi:hypothetical protein